MRVAGEECGGLTGEGQRQAEEGVVAVPRMCAAERGGVGSRAAGRTKEGAAADQERPR